MVRGQSPAQKCNSRHLTFQSSFQVKCSFAILHSLHSIKRTFSQFLSKMRYGCLDRGYFSRGSSIVRKTLFFESKVAKFTRTIVCFVIKATQDNSTSNTVKQLLGRYTKSWLEQQIGFHTVFSDLNS